MNNEDLSSSAARPTRPANWDSDRISKKRYERIQRHLMVLGPENPRAGEERHELNEHEYRAAVAAYEIAQHTSMSTALSIGSLLLALASLLFSLTKAELAPCIFELTVGCVVILICVLAWLAWLSTRLAEWEAYRAVQQLRDSQAPLAAPTATKRTGLFGRRRTRRTAR